MHRCVNVRACVYTHKFSTRILELNFPDETFFKNSNKEWIYLTDVYKSKLSYKNKQWLLVILGACHEWEGTIFTHLTWKYRLVRKHWSSRLTCCTDIFGILISIWHYFIFYYAFQRWNITFDFIIKNSNCWIFFLILFFSCLYPKR